MCVCAQLVSMNAYSAEYSVLRTPYSVLRLGEPPRFFKSSFVDVEKLLTPVMLCKGTRASGRRTRGTDTGCVTLRTETSFAANGRMTCGCSPPQIQSTPRYIPVFPTVYTVLNTDRLRRRRRRRRRRNLVYSSD
jgi:hypothetical protein